MGIDLSRLTLYNKSTPGFDIIGGEVTIPGGVLGALDGRIELGGVGANGVVNLTPTNTSFVLDYSAVPAFQDISLSESAFVITSGEGGGSIQVQGSNVSLRDRSFVFANTEGSGSGGGIVVEASQLSIEGGSRITTDVTGSGQGGDLTVNATESVRLIGVSPDGTLSSLGANVFRGATGNGGDVSITTGQLIVSDGAFVSADTFGEGDSGNLTVDASSRIQMIGTTANGQFPSGLFSQTVGTGNAGNVSITTGELMVSDGAQVNANTFGEGDGASLSVNASSRIQLIGTTADGQFASGLFSQTVGTGNSGNVSITTGELTVSDGAVVSAGSFGEGDGGNLTVNANSSVQVIGTSADAMIRSGLFSQANSRATGNAGDLTITTEKLIVSDGAFVSARTFGQGNAGELKITTGQLIVSDGAQVSASTRAQGNGANLTVDASESVQLVGTSASGEFSSGLFALTQGTGNAGELKITTGQLIVSDGAVVSASTRGERNGGKLTVNASESVQLVGTSADGRFPSRLTTQTEGTGNGGDVSITTEQLIVKDGARVLANTFDEGDSGNLTVDASSTVQVIGTSVDGRFSSGLSAQANPGSKGNAGELKITTGELIISDGAQVSASTFGEGDGGNLTVDASSTVQLISTTADGRGVSGLFTLTEGTGNAGRFLKITTDKLIISDGAQVLAGTRGLGNGGNLIVNASSTVQLIGTSASGEFSSGLFTQTEGIGNAGEFLKITTDKLIISDGAGISARSTQPRTLAGEVKINANSIFLDNNGRITAETAAGENSNIDNSNIKLFSRDIRLLNRSLILTDAKDTTIGGNITINTDTLVGLGNSDITANADQGSGGRVEINAKGIFGLEFRDDLTPHNDITSTSNLGSSSNGEVILKITQVDPTSGLNELPGILVDAEAILANDLCGFENDRIAGGSSFTITGKGGLPPTPEDPVINAHRTVRWRTRPRLPSTRQPLQAQAKTEGQATGTVRPRQDKKVIIEAQGWVVAKDGTIILTAQPFNGTPVEQIFPNLDCHAGKGNREQGAGNREE